MDLVARLPLRQPLPSTDPDGPQQWLTLVHVEVESDDSVASLRRRMFDYRNFLQGITTDEIGYSRGIGPVARDAKLKSDAP